MRTSVLLGLCASAMAVLLWPSGVFAQYIFADTDGDGVVSAADGLRASGATNVDIWLQTDRRRDGTAISTGNGPALGIFGYELVLRAKGGTVKWLGYTNMQNAMPMTVGQFESPTEFLTGFMGLEALPPGKYHLGRLRVQVTSGSPSIEFAPRSTLMHGGLTAFGSTYPGKQEDHYLKLAAPDAKQDEPGDWADADGVQAPRLTAESSSAAPGQEGETPLLDFGVRLETDPSNSTPLLAITTTKAGHLRVRVYDVRGRLVEAVVDRAAAPAGVHRIHLAARGAGSPRLASGIYFYRVEAAEGDFRGKLVLLR